MNEDSFYCVANALADLATTSQLVSDKVAKYTLKKSVLIKAEFVFCVSYSLLW